ncbi:PucR family transcriptional regulator [Thermanaeromonas sp. C210]|uniref:PucR family transcriptional regulator n=1 Tax=Thermanaeromonas sp. C210 TaxID=2731925 RepID=UPI00155B9315|nr:helix-turn-helix domain-containing protein [Thermanaeromonas sp. C210]GFN22938.1 CdaR family transcriptional regulator [Thermanaeromonas sp. C210]
MQIWRRFLEAAAAGEGLASVTRILREETGQPCLIMDVAFRVLASSFPPGTEDLWEEDILPCEVWRGTEGEEFFAGTLSVQGKQVDFLTAAIGHQELWGYLVLLGTRDEGYREYLRAASRAALVELSRLRAHQEAERRFRNEFIQDILYNNLPSREAIITRAQLWGWDLSRPQALVVLEYREPPEAGFSAAMERLRQLVGRVVSRECPQAIMADRSEQLILLLPHPSGSPGEAKAWLRKFWERVTGEIGRCLPRRDLVAGVGRFYASPDQLYRAYQEAKLALHVGRFLYPGAGITFFDELGALRFFLNQGEQELADFYEDVLGPVEEYDRQHNTNLLPTLVEFIRSSADYALTAERLYIHVNTLRYRLRKVEELLGVNLRDINTLLNLYAALQAKVILERL